MNINTFLSVSVLLVCLYVGNVMAQETLTNEQNKQNKPSATQSVTIESKVTGSQQQPKVLYIMPWQGISHPITIKDKQMEMVLPEFRPVYPKTFKKQVRHFAAQQIAEQQNRQ